MTAAVATLMATSSVTLKVPETVPVSDSTVASGVASCQISLAARVVAVV